MKPIRLIWLVICLFIILNGCKSPGISIEASAPTASPEEISLSPSNWPSGEFEAYVKMDNRAFPANPPAIGSKGAITSTFHSVASLAGLKALEKGGTSVDAALTAALTQVAMNAGSVISYFGIINMVHYDAATGDIVSMDATWNSVQDETEPMTIPGSTNYTDLFAYKKPSGRTALVGGFMKGVEAAHQRYGKLTFGELFDPAIYIAEEGIPLSKKTADFFKRRDDIIRRLPETKQTLVKTDGSSYVAGDIFKQPALAKTLKQVAATGADYMYTGAWAEKAVAAIQAEGGKMTMQDLADYEVIWNEPRKTVYGDYELSVLGPPVTGSVNLIEALNLAHISDIKGSGHWTESGDSFKKLFESTNMFSLSYLPQATLKMMYPTIDLTPDSRVKKETSQQLWEAIQKVKAAAQDQGGNKHSDTVVAIDQYGNMTAVTHSINCVVWGSTGIMVDGVSIGDPASFQQIILAQIKPGERVPSPIEVGILSKNGIPVLPFASMSTGLHQQTVQSLLNIIMFDMDIVESVNAPAQFLPLTDYSNPFAPKYTIRVMEGDFPQSVIEDSGLDVKEIPASERRYAQGLWVGIHKDPVTQKLTAVSPPYATGKALAH